MGSGECIPLLSTEEHVLGQRSFLKYGIFYLKEAEQSPQNSGEEVGVF